MPVFALLLLELTMVSSRNFSGSAGALFYSGSVITWGRDAVAHPAGRGEPRILARGDFGEGGCAMDVDGDGRQDLILQRGLPLGKLVWLRAPRWEMHVIDDEIEMHDCREAALFGRRGLLLIQRHMQVRFYAYPGWSSRDIYSIYTASKQTGLLLHDVDGDGRTDILCGNYWIRSPREFELPWRLFAINLWHEEGDSAMLRLALDGNRLVAVQGHRNPARAAVFEKPGPPTGQWPATDLPPLRFPHALLKMGHTVFIGENDGASSRLLWIEDLAKPRLEWVAAGHGIHTLLARGEDELVAVGPSAISTWRVRRGR